MEKTTKSKYPEEGELVIGTITKIFPHGAFVKLKEYPNQEGLIHISELSSKWIKNIKDYVREGELVILKVLKIDKEKGHIDLSLKSVKAAHRKQKTEQYKRENRSKKLLEFAGKKLDDKENVEKIYNILEKEFEDVYASFEKATKGGENVFLDAKVPEKWAKTLAKIAKEQVEIPKVTIKVVLELHSNLPNGMELIRDSLVKAEQEYNKNGTSVKISYLGAPKYRLEIKADNYKVAESCLNNLSSSVIGAVSKKDGNGKLIRNG